MRKQDTLSYEVDDFKRDVIQASHERPVLVDFWAPWCGPCRVIGPSLEKLAQASSSEWTLAKVNVDNHPDLARRYGVRGIPAVKLFIDGTVADEFTGALPEHTIRKWLEENLPGPARKQLEQAQALLDAGQREGARPLIDEVLHTDPGNNTALLLLARTIVFEDPERARELADQASISGPTDLQIAESVQTVVRLMKLNENPEPLPEGHEQPLYREAIEAMGQGEFDTALDRFIVVIQRNRDYDKDGARKACLALFTLLGKQHPAVQSHRRAFDMSLY